MVLPGGAAVIPGSTRRAPAEAGPGQHIARMYAAKLLDVGVAAKAFGLSLATFHRLRRRHGIKTLIGQKIHVDDVINALEQERKCSLR